MTTPHFSIAMATYNGERFLQEQLDSISGQSLVPYELVVCDDASSDATVSILKDFRTKAPFDVHIYENERNLGYGDNFLKAASLCKGDWIAFCDQDDVWLEAKLRRYTEVIAAHPEAVLLSHSAEQVDANLIPLPHRVPDHKALSVTGPLCNNPVLVTLGFTSCVRRSLLDQIPMDERREDIHQRGRRESHDQFIYHVANTYGYIVRMPDTLALYRRHGTAVSGNKGTGVHDHSFTGKLKAWRYANEDVFLRMVNHAYQRREFYQRILDRVDCHRAEDVFGQRTRDAVTYYERVAAALEARSRIYRPGARVAGRGRAFLQSLRRGVYSNPPAGCGFGKGSLAKDLLRIFFAW